MQRAKFTKLDYLPLWPYENLLTFPQYNSQGVFQDYMITVAMTDTPETSDPSTDRTYKLGGILRTGTSSRALPFFETD